MKIFLYILAVTVLVGCSYEKERVYSCGDLQGFKEINACFDSVPDSLVISIADVAMIENWLNPIDSFLSKYQHDEIVSFVRKEKNACKIWGNQKDGILYKIDLHKISFTEKKVNGLVYYQGRDVNRSKPVAWLQSREVERMKPICDNWYHVVYIEKTRGF